MMTITGYVRTRNFFGVLQTGKQYNCNTGVLCVWKLHSVSSLSDSEFYSLDHQHASELVKIDVIFVVMNLFMSYGVFVDLGGLHTHTCLHTCTCYRIFDH